MLGDIEAETGFSQAGTCGDDDEIRGMQSGRHAVEIDKSGFQAGHGSFSIGQFLDLLEDVADDRGDGRKAGMELLAGDIEYRLFDVLQNFLGGFLVLVAARHGLVGDLDQAAQSRFFLDDLGVVLDVHRARQAVGEACQVGGASDAFEFVGALEFFLERDQIDRPGAVHQLEHLLEDPPVAVEIEVLRLEGLEDRKHSFVVEEYRSQDRTLRLQVVGKRFFQADVGHFELTITIDELTN